MSVLGTYLITSSNDLILTTSTSASQSCLLTDSSSALPVGEVNIFIQYLPSTTTSIYSTFIVALVFAFNLSGSDPITTPDNFSCIVNAPTLTSITLNQMFQGINRKSIVGNDINYTVYTIEISTPNTINTQFVILSS